MWRASCRRFTLLCSSAHADTPYRRFTGVANTKFYVVQGRLAGCFCDFEYNSPISDLTVILTILKKQAIVNDFNACRGVFVKNTQNLNHNLFTFAIAFCAEPSHQKTIVTSDFCKGFLLYDFDIFLRILCNDIFLLKKCRFFDFLLYINVFL